MTPATVHRGETISLALDAVAGDVGTVSAVSAMLRKTSAGIPVGASVATVAVVARTASGDIPAGWTLTVSAAQSAALVAGSYAVDAKLTVGSATIITDAVAIRIIEPVNV